MFQKEPLDKCRKMSVLISIIMFQKKKKTAWGKGKTSTMTLLNPGSCTFYHTTAAWGRWKLSFQNNHQLRTWLNTTKEGEGGELDLCKRHWGAWWVCEPECSGRFLGGCLGGQHALRSMHVTGGCTSLCGLEKWTAIQTKGKSINDG